MFGSAGVAVRPGRGERIIRVNYQVFELVNGWAGHSAALDAVMTFAATYLLYLVFGVGAAVAAYALYRRRIRPVLLTAAALTVAFAVNVAVGLANHEQRPFQTHHVTQLITHEAGTSLPSDHATAAFTLALAVGWFLHRRWGIALLVAAVVIGVARIWVGVHYPGDILASLVIAVAAVLATASAGRAIERRRAPSGSPAA